MATEWISRDHVVAALDMCAVLAHYDIKAGHGSSFRIHCPFHDDERPSCSVNQTNKLYNCFGCGEHGNVLDFIAGMEGLDPGIDFRAILEQAIEIIGHNPTPQMSRKARHKTDLKKRETAKGNKPDKEELDRNGPDSNRSDSNRSGSNRPGKKKPDAKSGKKTKKKAGKTKKKTQKPAVSIKADGSLELEPNRVLEGPAFPLKLQSSHSWLDERLDHIGVSQSMAEDMGIGFESRSNALMANRVCFPIHNANGELVAYAGRWTSDDADEQGRFFTGNGREQPRYRLPKGFQKQLELFNWHRVRKEFTDANSHTIGTIVLVEGFWSVLRLHVHAIPAVALMGLSISDAQIRLLSKGGIGSVLLMLDGDKEGKAASEVILPKLASHFFTRLICLPQGIKPDEAEQSVLNEVKALCAGTASQPQAKAQEKAVGKIVKKQKDTNFPLARTTATKPLALPAASMTASMSWSGLS